MKRTLTAAALATLLTTSAFAGTFDPDKAKLGLPSTPPAPASTPQAASAAPATPTATPQPAPTPAPVATPAATAALHFDNAHRGCVARIIPLPTYQSSNSDFPAGYMPPEEKDRFLAQIEELQDKGVDITDFKIERYSFPFGAHTKAPQGFTGRAAYRIRCTQEVDATGDWAYAATFKLPTSSEFYGALTPPPSVPPGSAKLLLPTGGAVFPYVMDVKVGTEEANMTSVLHAHGVTTIDGGQVITQTGIYHVDTLRFISQETRKPVDMFETEFFLVLTTGTANPGNPWYARDNQDKVLFDHTSWTIAVRGPNDHGFAPPTNIFFHGVETEAAGVAAPATPIATPPVAAPAAAAQPVPAAPLAPAPTPAAPAPAPTPVAPAPAPAAPAPPPAAPAPAAATSGASSPANLPSLGASVAPADDTTKTAAAPSKAGGAATAAPHPAAGSSDLATKAVQERLNAMGYDAGTADGTLGAKTTAAVKKFQADIGVAQTGKINQTLLTQIYSSNRTPTTGNAATGTIATGSLGGLPQSFVSQLSTNQIQRIRAAITTALTSQFETDGPFPFLPMEARARLPAHSRAAAPAPDGATSDVPSRQPQEGRL